MHSDNLSLIAYVNFALTSFKAVLVLLFVAWAMMSIEKSKTDGIVPNAEYVLNMKWDTGKDWDVDIWIQTPAGNIVYYSATDLDLVKIERDDKGLDGDEALIDGEKMTNDVNQEIVSIRGIVPGEYIVNIELYRYATDSMRADTERKGARLPVPVHVNVQMLRMNPQVVIEFDKDLTLTEYAQELHVNRFTINRDGSVTNITDSLPEEIVSKRVTYRTMQ